jgi:hypothetical protein
MSTWMPTRINEEVRILDTEDEVARIWRFPDSLSDATASFSLDPSIATPTENNDAANWSASAEGVNGSWQSTSGDWGSPGHVPGGSTIPEPGTMGLGLLALVAGGAVRYSRQRAGRKGEAAKA